MSEPLFNLMCVFRENLLDPKWSDQCYPVGRGEEPRVEMRPHAYYESVWWLFHLVGLAKKMAPRVSPEGQVLLAL